MSRASKLLVAALPTVASSLFAGGIPPRPNDRAIHDLSGTLAAPEIADLERRAETVLRSGAAVAVLVRFHRSDADEAGDDARRLLREWEVERETGRVDGVVVVVNLTESDPKHGVAAIHVGKGLRNGNLPPREVNRIWRDEMRPALRNGDVAAGIGKGLDAVARSLRDGPAPPSPAMRAAAELATGVLLPSVVFAGPSCAPTSSPEGSSTRRREDDLPGRPWREGSSSPWPASSSWRQRSEGYRGLRWTPS